MDRAAISSILSVIVNVTVMLLSNHCNCLHAYHITYHNCGVFISENNCSTLQCQEGFSCSAVANTSICLPVCGRWAQYPHGTMVAIDVAIVLSATIGVLASIAVLVVSCIRWERMYV